MQQTTYYQMNLPDGPDRYNIEDFNQNTRIIDEYFNQNDSNYQGITEHFVQTDRRVSKLETFKETFFYYQTQEPERVHINTIWIGN